MDYRGIKQQYPNAWKLFILKFGECDSLLHDRDLYEFFDMFKIRIGIVPDMDNGDEFFVANMDLNDNFTGRKEAEEAAFLKAWQILEEMAKNAPYA